MNFATKIVHMQTLKNSSKKTCRLSLTKVATHSTHYFENCASYSLPIIYIFYFIIIYIKISVEYVLSLTTIDFEPQHIQKPICTKCTKTPKTYD